MLFYKEIFDSGLNSNNSYWSKESVYRLVWGTNMSVRRYVKTLYYAVNHHLVLVTGFMKTWSKKSVLFCL